MCSPEHPIHRAYLTMLLNKLQFYCKLLIVSGLIRNDTQAGAELCQAQIKVGNPTRNIVSQTATTILSSGGKYIGWALLFTYLVF